MRILFLIMTILHLLTYAQEVDYQSRIDTEEEFSALKGEPLSNKFGKVSALKVVYDLKADKLYYINSKRFEFHLNFCEDILDYNGGSFNFNYNNYTKTEHRRYLLATINNYESQDIYTLEFSVADQIIPQQIKILHKRIVDSFSITDSLYLFLNTARLEELKPKLDPLPVVDVESIYNGQTFQPIVLGESNGYLRFLKSDKYEDVGFKDIVVFEGVPNDLPPCSGVLCNRFQTPLSHITILCQNRHTPFCSDRLILQDSALKNFEGKPVSFVITQDGYIIKEVDSSVVESETAIEEVEIPAYDDQYKEINWTKELSYKDVNRVGAKAANFAELDKLLSKKNNWARAPEGGFAIPFYYYLEHLKASGADTLISKLSTMKPGAESDQLLKNVRKRIKAHPVDSELVSQVRKKMTASGWDRYRFRSSTNAEDIEGFNGAGLYESATAVLGDSSKTIEKAIKKVWASVWSYRAHFEREYFNVDNANLAMGILAHRGFPNEHANGVAITKNIYRTHYNGFVVNLQIGELSVVKPEDGVECEQFITYSDGENTFFDPKRIVEYISKSSETNGEPILTELEIVRLSHALSDIKKHFYRKVNKNWLKYEYLEFGLDIEFKIDGPGRRIYIKQARPYPY